MTASPDPALPSNLTLGFTGSPLDRADHMRRDAAAVQAARMDPTARYLILQDLKPCLTTDKSDIYWARRSEVPTGTQIFLGLTPEGDPRFAVDGTPDDDLPLIALDARQAGAHLPTGPAAIIAQARSVLDWHRRHRFCANCGMQTQIEKAGYSRLCQSCGSEHFPRVDPVVIMLAEKDDKVLVGRGANFPGRFFSALAGFLEAGESLEEAVARELYEEAGVRVSHVRYGASQPWPFPSSLMLGAYATADSFDLKLDTSEIAEAMWVTKAEVQAALRGEAEWTAPPPLAIAHWLLANWANS